MVVVGAAAYPRPASAQEPTAELSQESARAGYPLQQQPDGSLVYDGPRFVARIAPDGAVSFTDRNADYRLGGLLYALPEGQFVAPPEEVTDTTLMPSPWYPVYGSPATTRFTSLPAMAPERMGFPDPPSMRRLPIQPSIAGGGLHFDVTDAYLRAQGDDPYRDQKARFIEATFETRLQRASLHRHAVTKLALFDLKSSLERIWNDPTLDSWEKREVLQQLRDETDDTPEGRQARAIIERFMRTRLALR